MNFGTRSYHHPASDYFTPMDQEGPEDPNSHDHIEHNDNYDKENKDNYGLNLGIKDIGMSVPMGISAANVAGIYSKIRMGAGNIEIQFPGYRSGQRNAQTPEMLGEDQRQAIREMAMANEVNFTTHASFQLMGMMGRDERGNFSLYNATQDMFELKRAIDFQSDLGGGSVVIHSGEFERPMTDMYLDDETGMTNLARDPNGRLLVKQSHTQEQDAKFELMDDRTSGKIESVQKDKLVAHPVWLREKGEGRWGENQHGDKKWINKGDFIDYEGHLIEDPYHPMEGRVPEFNEGTRLFEVKLKTFEEFRKEAEEYNHYFEKKHGRKPDYYEKRYPEEEYVKATLDSQEGYARGWSLRFSSDSQRTIKVLKELQKAKEYYEKLDKEMPEEELWKIYRQDAEIQQYSGGFAPSEMVHPLKLIEKQIKDNERTLEYYRTTAASQEQSAKDTRETKDHIITPIKRLEKHGIRNYAETAIHAMRKTKDPNDPVVLAVEHIFPERFGGHIEELKWIIKKTRERMVDMLTEPEIEYGASLKPEELDKEKLDKGIMQPNPYYMGISREEASKLAEKHVKATIDTGHLNLWRKYWQEDPRMTKEQNDEAFKNWILSQVESIAKEGMVGNVHLADNYGYHDDHLAPGQGNAPIKEVMSIIKKHGYDKAITVEPGADASTDLSDFHGLMKTWKFFGSGVYGMGFGGPSVPQSFGDIHYSFLGQNKPPNYVFGAYAPSNDWTLWSSVPLE